MFIPKSLGFNFALAAALILFSICPAKALTDLSDTSVINSSRVYNNVGRSPTTGYGLDESSTSTTTNLSMLLKKYVALAINTSVNGNLSPGGPFGSNTVPFSQFAITASMQELKNNSVPEFIIKGLVASNTDNVGFNVDTGNDGDGGLINLNDNTSAVSYTFTGYSAFTGGSVLNQPNTYAIRQNPVDMSAGGIAQFRVEVNVLPNSIDYDTDRSGTYAGIIIFTAFVY